ncbi:hypothetical protein AAFF_G00199860 [Aldrovandia affinis]|uniref:Calponin-homology (CH) domain-containing protein n=1 Tax=Aldrovandia affinis TaxID=143900 RepID=A0AAD7RI80_9TELE|nr:hypothetical protein AAFF_G00199860 [Aldrovandia affinis]
MGSTSTPPTCSNGSNGSHGRRTGLFGEWIIENATRQQFNQSDRVKQFHRELLLSETLYDRKIQVEGNLMIKNAADEEARKCMAEIRRTDMAGLEKEQQIARQREVEKRAYGEDLRQQMREMEQRRVQKKLRKEMEIEESNKLEKQYHRQQWLLKRKQQQEATDARNCHLEHLASKTRHRARDNTVEKQEEEDRRRFVFQKDLWTDMCNENRADRSRQRESQSEMLGEVLAAQERDKTRKCDLMNARTIAKSVAQQDATFYNSQDCKKLMNLEMASSIAAHREYKHQEQQFRAMEERRAEEDMLQANKDADRAYRDGQRLVAQRKREGRMVMDNALHQQIAQKRVQEQARMRDEAAFDQRNFNVLAQEDLEFQMYAKGNAHLAVMDALMSAVAMETVSAVKMPGGVEQLGDGAGWENALLYWISRLNQKLREITEEVPQSSPPSTDLQPVQPSCPTRWYWKLVPVNPVQKGQVASEADPTFPLVTGVKDLSNGCAVAAVIHFYCPDLLRLEDVCLKDTMSVADSLYNLQLIRDFCASCLKSCCPLLLEDLLYTPPGLRVNILSFMAELLEWFEGEKITGTCADASVLPDCITPTSGNSSSASPAFIFKQPFLPISSPVSPGGGKEGMGRAWSRKQISRPLSAVTFSIPFGLDSDVDIVMGNPVGVIKRSVSSDSVASALPAMTRVSYTPPEDLSHLLSKAPESPGPRNGPLAPQRASWGTQTRRAGARRTGWGRGRGRSCPPSRRRCRSSTARASWSPASTPTGRPTASTCTPPTARRASAAPPRPAPGCCTGRPARGRRGRGWSPRQSRSTASDDGSRDDDSVLRDGSVDSDASEDLAKTQCSPPAPVSPSLGVTMTSFAERKKRQAAETPPAGEPPHMTTWAQRSEESPSKSPALSMEMSELGARLEEKRKAIESQKKRIEAIFAKHRQRLGKSALLQLKKEQQQQQEGGRGGRGRQGGRRRRT